MKPGNNKRSSFGTLPGGTEPMYTFMSKHRKLIDNVAVVLRWFFPANKTMMEALRHETR